MDDNPDHADSEALFLRVIGFEARASYGGRDAILLAGAFLPDVCLLDLHMPGMGGDELAARLAAVIDAPGRSTQAARAEP